MNLQIIYHAYKKSTTQKIVFRVQINCYQCVLHPVLFRCLQAQNTMGCAASSSNETTSSRSIDRQLRKDAAKEATVIKLLLLGSGDAGKSTIMKQVCNNLQQS